MRKHPLLAFFVLTFAITWGIGACYALFPDHVIAAFGPISHSNPLFYLAVYAPSLSAIAMTAYADGIAGLRDLLSRLFRWRVGLQWYAAVFLGMPALIVASAVLSAWLAHEPFQFGAGHRQLALVPVLLTVVMDPGPLGEELGWRGFALPRLLRGRSALSASVILGFIWGFWHLPAFFIVGLPQSRLSIPAFMVGTTALSVLMTGVFQHTRGSVLVAVVIHWIFNTDYLPRGSFPVLAVVLTVAALVVVGVSWPNWLSRKHDSSDADTARVQGRAHVSLEHPDSVITR
jgi:membrane protease YdiL (CAAX protease family)